MTSVKDRDRSWLAAAALVTVGVTAAGLLATAATAAAATPQQVGSAPAVPHGAVRTGAVAATKQLHLSVQLAPRNPAALAAFTQSVADPHSVNYKHYLAAGEFGPMFGAAPATVVAVTNELRAAGLNPGPVSENDLSIPVTATAAQAESAFGVGISTFKLASGRVAFANTTAPKLPAAVAGSVQAVLGLNDLVDLTTHVALGKGARFATRSVTPRPHSAGPVMCADVQNFVDSNPAEFGQDTQNYWLPQTLSAAGAYDTQQLYGGYGNTGAGVTVALFELERFNPEDISFYQQCFGTHVPITTVPVDGGPADPPDRNTGVGVESAIDIESILGMAPGVSLRVYQGPDVDAGESDATIEDTYRRIVSDDSAQVISTSWGLCEVESDPALISAEGTIFAQAAAQGQSVVAASGDSGSTDCFEPALPGGPNDATLSVDDPAGQPLVTAAGGTSMTGLGPQTLTTWNSPADGVFFAGGAGGGVSAVHQLSGAANYQQGVTGAGYSNACGAPDGSFCRQVPDVSALADPHQGFLTFWGTDDTDGSILVEPDGGTSLAAPLTAAVLALADASTACAANGPAGFANPALYAHPSSLKDVTTGDNDVTASGFTGGLYQAGTGYDMATGLGSLQAPQLVEAVCGTPAGAGSTFTPVAPTRVLDTRNAIGVPGRTPIGANSSIKLQVSGTHGVPATGVTAVVLNVTATAPTVGGVFTVWPDGKPKPASSNLNFTKGETIANLVTVPVGADGAVDVFNLAGTTHAVADLEGYYTAGSGSLYDPLTPVRVLDTRNAIGVPTRTPIGAGQFVKLQVAGTHGVPATGVTSAVLNVTATAPTVGGVFTVYPDGTARPTASNLNFTKGETIPNLVTVAVGADGAVDVFNLAGTTHAVVDLEGYYTNTDAGLKFHPSTPHRLVDTRNGTGVAAGQHAPIGPNGTFALPLTDTNGPGNAGPLATSGALSLNVTVTAPTVGGVLTVYPSGVAKPGVSNLNFTANETIPNAVLTPVNGTSINFTNLSGNTQAVVDLFGYFSQN